MKRYKKLKEELLQGYVQANVSGGDYVNPHDPDQRALVHHIKSKSDFVNMPDHSRGVIYDGNLYMMNRPDIAMHGDFFPYLIKQGIIPHNILSIKNMTKGDLMTASRDIRFYCAVRKNKKKLEAGEIVPLHLKGIKTKVNEWFNSIKYLHIPMVKYVENE